MEIIWIITHIVAWGAGLITGMYFSSQIEKDIDKRIEDKENYESFTKKHYKKP
jgi:uncharacterized protein YneF (UPF0154 family)